MRKKNNNFYLFLIILSFFVISVGYAVISRTLTINGNSEVKQNTWDMHFENIQVITGSVASVRKPTIDNTKLSIDFSFNLDLPGDFYEFTVDVKNAGTIDAMIDSINKTPELTETQKKYLNYVIEYQSGELVKTKQVVKAGELVRLKVRVEYRTDITEFDLPTTTQNLNLGFVVNYVQADSTGIVVENNGIKITPISYGSVDAIGTVVTIGDQQFYTIGTEGDNVKLLSMYNLHVGNYFGHVDEDEVNLVAFNNSKVNSNNLNYVNSNYVVSKLAGEPILPDGIGLYSLPSPTQKQNSLAKGSISTGYPYIGVTQFSSSSQKGTKYSDYSGSIVESYVNNYRNILEVEYGLDVVEARLITKEELTNENIRCVESNSKCSAAPTFIYSTSYWVGTAYNDTRIFAVTSSGNLYNYYYYEEESLGVRPVIVIPKDDIVVDVVRPTANGSLDEIGTVVTIGTEQFYTIGTEGDNVKLLAKYNLHVGYYAAREEISVLLSSSYYKNSNFIVSKLAGEPVEPDVIYSYPLVSPTQKQSSTALGYTSKGYPYVGVTEFSNDSTKGTNYSDYNGSVVEGYVNNYKNLLENDYGIDIVSARLITKEELLSEEIGCTTSSCSGAPSFIYASSYWVGSAYSTIRIWTVSSSNSLTNYSYESVERHGVRPVIVVSKSLF